MARPQRQAAQNANNALMANTNKAAQELAATNENIAANEPGAAETLLTLSTPLDFST